MSGTDDGAATDTPTGAAQSTEAATATATDGTDAATGGDLDNATVVSEHEDLSLPVEVSAVERREIESRAPYSEFVKRTARIVERALAVDYDILVDYTIYRGDEGCVCVSVFVLLACCEYTVSMCVCVCLARLLLNILLSMCVYVCMCACC